MGVRVHKAIGYGTAEFVPPAGFKDAEARLCDMTIGDFAAWCREHRSEVESLADPDYKSARPLFGWDIRIMADDLAAESMWKSIAWGNPMYDGPEAFVGETLERVTTLQEAYAAEMKWIAEYRTTDPEFGYNSTEGGEGHIISEETKEKMRAAARRRVESTTHEERSLAFSRGEANRKATIAARTPEQRADIAARKSAASKAYWSSRTPEQRAEHGRKAMAGRGRDND